MHHYVTKFSIFLIFVTLSSIHSASIWDIFGSNKNKGPKPEEGECSHWDQNNLYFASYDSDDLIGFHRTYPQGSYVSVYNEATNKSVVVRIVAHGPLADGRVMELSPAAFTQVSRLSEVVFDCKVYRPIEKRPGPGPTPPAVGGYHQSGVPGSGLPLPGVGGYHQSGTGGHTTGSRRPTGGSYGTGHGTGSHGSGFEVIDALSEELDSLSEGTLDPMFGPPPVLGGGGDYSASYAQKQHKHRSTDDCSC